MESIQNVDTAATVAAESIGANSDEQSSGDSNHEQETSKIGVYCTLRSRSLGDHKGKSQHDGDQYSIKDNLTTYCTVGRRLKNFIKTSALENELPYTKLNESLSTSSTNFGISNNLSTESIKNACELYVLSDDESDEVDPRRSVEAVNGSLLDKITGSNFRRSLLRSSARSSSTDRKRRHENFHPYCTMRRDRFDRLPDKAQSPDLNSDKINPDSAEAYHILNELDAILDNQEGIEIASVSSSSPEKVEDYLLELDTYLEQMERCGKQGSDDHQQENLEAYLRTSDANNFPKHAQRSETLPKKLRRLIAPGDPAEIVAEKKISAVEADLNYSFDRGHKLRSTVGSSQPESDRIRLIHGKSLAVIF
ncbi:unnamed protein product [Hermetia illucens]|uniref:Uncharacterized protein n=1 Tax=Hermetia illucens TaxID=343691 RepID=A0A7R8UZS9_HERIL|nr:unnamed protein product [Hermetia illucens]